MYLYIFLAGFIVILGINYYSQRSGRTAKLNSSKIQFSDWDNKLKSYIKNNFAKEISPIKAATSNPSLTTLTFLSGHFKCIKMCSPSYTKHLKNEISKKYFEPIAFMNNGWILGQGGVFFNLGVDSIHEPYSNMSEARYVKTIFGQCSFKNRHNKYIGIPSENYIDSQIIFKLLDRYVSKKEYIKIAENVLKPIEIENFTKKKLDDHREFEELKETLGDYKVALKELALKNPQDLDILADRMIVECELMGSDFFSIYADSQIRLKSFFSNLKKAVNEYIDVTLTFDRIHLLKDGRPVEGDKDLTGIIDDLFKKGTESIVDYFSLEINQQGRRYDDVIDQLEFMGIIKLDYDRSEQYQLLVTREEAKKLLKDQGTYVRSYERFAAINTDGILKKYVSTEFSCLFESLNDLINLNNQIVEVGLRMFENVANKEKRKAFSDLKILQNVMLVLAEVNFEKPEELTESRRIIERVKILLGY